jgi:DNA-binding MarR family transcriptional regulator
MSNLSRYRCRRAHRASRPGKAAIERAPRKPLGMMLLAYLWIQPSQSGSYADLRAACKLEDSSSLSHAIKRLTKAGYVETFASENDTRERELRLLQPGRGAVGQLLHVAFGLKGLGQHGGK